MDIEKLNNGVKQMARKTREFLKDVTAFLCGFIAMGLINLF